MQGANMKQLYISQRINDCIDNEWADLLTQIDNITQNVIETPSAGNQIKAALILWADSVDVRTSKLPPEDVELLAHNPSMGLSGNFGAED